MAQAVEPDRGAPSVTFEVERFEARGRDRMFLSGRWFGLRGRRFVRPTLTLGTDGHRQRALADLEHKPWAAKDGDLWEATFPYEHAGEDLGNLELTVAPDITISLPEPGSGASEQQIRARPRRDDLLDNLRGARRDGRPRPGSGSAADPRRAGRSATPWEDGSEAQREAPRMPQTPPPVGADGSSGAGARRSNGSPDLPQSLSRAQREIAVLKAQLAHYEGAQVKAASTRGDGAVARATETSPTRDRALRARDQAVRARDQALRERDRAAAERDQALRERDRAVAKAKKLSEAAAAHRGVAPAVARSRAATSQGIIWAQRFLAVSVLVIVVLAFAVTARLV